MEIVMSESKYRFEFTVCGNIETVREGHDWGDDAANYFVRELSDLLYAIPHVFNVDISNRFSEWHGGKYSHQAKMHGYERFGVVVCTAVITMADADTDDDVDPWEYQTWAQVPADIQQAMTDKVEQAIAAAVKSADEFQADWNSK
jgi:hypothetical protein